MKLHLQSDNGVTLIENRFIDQYMPSANGEYVKLYLYLLDHYYGSAGKRQILCGMGCGKIRKKLEGNTEENDRWDPSRLSGF